MTAFTLGDIPDQTGRRAIVTGATGGLGYETAQALAGAGRILRLGRLPRTQGTGGPRRGRGASTRPGRSRAALAGVGGA